MQIIWQNENLKSQYAFRQHADWSGLKIHHAQVMPGRMLEHAAEFHEINIPLSGRLVTERITPTGKRKTYIIIATTAGFALHPPDKQSARFGTNRSIIWEYFSRRILSKKSPLKIVFRRSLIFMMRFPTEIRSSSTSL